MNSYENPLMTWAEEAFVLTYMQDIDNREIYKQKLKEILSDNPNLEFKDIPYLLAFLGFYPNKREIEDVIEFQADNFQAAMILMNDFPLDTTQSVKWKTNVHRKCVIKLFKERHDQGISLAFYYNHVNSPMTMLGILEHLKSELSKYDHFVVVNAMIFLGIGFNKEDADVFLTENVNEHQIFFYATLIIDLFQNNTEYVKNVKREFDYISNFI
jgi:hypothetical protein